MRYEHSVEIERPRAVVFRYMDDVAREPEWQPNLVEATQDPSGDTAPGTRKRYVSEFMGKRVVNVWVARSVDAGREVVYRTTDDSTLRATVTLRWRDTDSGGTAVSMAVDGTPTGALRFIPMRILEAASRSELERAFERLKGRLEGGVEGS